MSSSPPSAITETTEPVALTQVEGASSALHRPDGNAPDDLTRLSHLGFRGTAIPRHRAIRWLDRPGRRAIHSLAFALVAWLGVLASMQPVADAWSGMLGFWLERTMPGVQFVATSANLLSASLSEPRLGAASPTPAQWLNITATTTVLLLVTLLLPRRLLPLIYMLRLMAIVQLSASLFFLLAPASYPYAGGAHATTILRCGWASMLLLPWIFAFCYYPLEHGWTRHVALTLLGEVFFALVTPLLAAWEVVLVHYGSLLLHPLLYLVFGPPLFVFWFICLYGWGMSWPDAPARKRAWS